MSSLKVYFDKVEKHPHCSHGPTLLFSRQVKGRERKFFACSAYRNRKDCPFFLWEDEKISQEKLLYWQKRELEAVSSIDHHKIYLQFCKFKLLPIKDRKFCYTCFTFVFAPDISSHDHHFIGENISDKLLKYPTLLIEPIECSKKEAQFWFSENTKQFIINTLKTIRASTCLSVGAPSLHELLRETKIKSLLLDIDKRYHYFYSEEEFCWFNMFNCYFLSNGKKCQLMLKNYLNASTVGVVIDPPFGARLEPLAKTVGIMQKQASNKLNIFLILPYFMENIVMKYFPNFIMLDYQVQYTNHNKFRNRVGKKKPSPVRIFTNVSPFLIKMPESEGYYYCEDCNCWRSRNNKHCNLCNTCPSKNGETYIHCTKCLKCVKKSWKHCVTCRRCCAPFHVCDILEKELQKTRKAVRCVSPDKSGNSMVKKRRKN